MLLGDLGPTGHGLLLGERRGDPRVPGSPTPHCEPAAMNGSRPACSTGSATTRVHAYDRIIGLDLSEVVARRLVCTKHRAAGKAQARTPQTGPNWAGSGRSRPTPMASRSAGPSMAPTATTSRSWARPSTTWHGPDCSARSRRCTSIVATTTRRSAPSSAGLGLDDLNIQRRARTERHEHAEAATRARAALGRRGDQLVVLELRATPPQHRPAKPSTDTPNSAS